MALHRSTDVGLVRRSLSMPGLDESVKLTPLMTKSLMLGSSVEGKMLTAFTSSMSWDCMLAT